MNDPYNGIIDFIREEGAYKNKPSFYIGEITSKLPDLKVKVCDTELDKKNLMIDKWLLDRATETFIDFDEGNHSHGDATGPGAHKHEMKEPLKDILDVGDSVIMLRNKDTFIITNKVVSI